MDEHVVNVFLGKKHFLGGTLTWGLGYQPP